MALTNLSTPSALTARRHFASPDENSDPSQFSAAAFQASLAAHGSSSLKLRNPRKATAPSLAPPPLPCSTDVLGSLPTNRPTARARRTQLAAMQSEDDVSLAIAALPLPSVLDEDTTKLLDVTFHLASLSSPVPAVTTTPSTTRHQDLMGKLATLRELHASRKAATAAKSGLTTAKEHRKQKSMTEEELDRLDEHELERLAWGAMDSNQPSLRARTEQQDTQINLQASPQRRARYRRHQREEPASSLVPAVELTNVSPAAPAQPVHAAATPAPKVSLLRKPSHKALLPLPATASTKAAVSSTVSTTKSNRSMPSAPASSPVPCTERVPTSSSAMPGASSAVSFAPAPTTAVVDAAPSVVAAVAVSSSSRLLLPQSTATSTTVSSSTQAKDNAKAQSPSKLPRKSALPMPSRSAALSVPKMKKSGVVVPPAAAAVPVSAPKPVTLAAEKVVPVKEVVPEVMASCEPAIISEPVQTSLPACAPPKLADPTQVSEFSHAPVLNEPQHSSSCAAALVLRKNHRSAGPTLPLSPFARSRRAKAVRDSAVKAVAVVRSEVVRGHGKVCKRQKVGEISHVVVPAVSRTQAAAAGATGAAPVPAGYRLSSTGTLLALSKSSTFTFVARDARSAASARARSLASAQAMRTTTGPKANAVPAWLKARKAQLEAEEAARLEAEVERVREMELAKGRKPSSSTRRIVSSDATPSTAAVGGFVSSMEARAHERAAWEEKRALKQATLDQVRSAARAEREAKEEQEYKLARAKSVIRANPVPSAIYGPSSSTTTTTTKLAPKNKPTAFK